MWLRVALLALLALTACADDSRSTTPLFNRCTQQLDCTRGSCDLSVGICVQTVTSTPYDYQVRITPPDPGDGGQQLAVARSARSTLLDAGMLSATTLAAAVTVSGRVVAEDGKTIEAEVAFTPRDDLALGGALSVFTRAGAAGQSYAALLEPNRLYDVIVYPRGPDSLGSAGFPPFSFDLQTAEGDQVKDFVYPALTSLSGDVLQENGAAPTAGMHIKTRYRDRLLASSSIGTVDRDGGFAVRLPPQVLDMPDAHVLALDLSGVQTPQNVQVELDMGKHLDGGAWVIPTLPNPVQYTGTVEANIPVNAQLSFISNFPPLNSQGDQRQVDWCELKLPGAPRETFRCTANVSGTANGGGNATDVGFSVLLMPGLYQVVAVPSAAGPSMQRLGISYLPQMDTRIQTQPDASSQSGGLVELSSASLYVARVRSPDGRPMPSVTVSANALNILDDLPISALYNRSDRQLTAYDGNATLAADIGRYDVIATPPDGTGYAWRLLYNRRIVGTDMELDAGPPEFLLDPQLPVLLKGSAVSSAGTAVAQASVDAYALVPDLSGGPDRAVRIAHAMTDRDGKFTLQMPSRIGANDDVVGDGGAPLNAVFDMDAGLDVQR